MNKSFTRQQQQLTVLSIVLVFVSCFLIVLCKSTVVATESSSSTKVVYKAVCSFKSTNPEYSLDGLLTFNWNIDDGSNQVTGTISGVEPNVEYTIKIHESGDLSHSDGTSVGNVFSLVDTIVERVMSDSDGIITVRSLNKNWTLRDERSIVGRSVLLRQLTSGDAYAQCVVGIQNPTAASSSSGSNNNNNTVVIVNDAMANEPGESFKYATCEIRGETNQKIRGRAIFSLLGNDAIQVRAKVCGLSDGYHGFHIHQYGDLSGSIDLVGSHFDKGGHSHGIPSEVSSNVHTGDLGNLYSSNGAATLNATFTHFSLRNDTSILGHALIIHSGKDFGSEFQPAGASGVKIAKCIIGTKNTVPSLSDVHTCPPLVKVKRAICVLKPTALKTEVAIEGEIVFESSSNGNIVSGTVSGLGANSMYGFHVHEYGDTNKIGDHFNPAGTSHSNNVTVENRHAGDLGNIVSDDGGNVDVNIENGLWTLSGTNSVIGRTLVIDNQKDDGVEYDDQSVVPMAQCVIGIENVENNVAKADNPGASFIYATSEIYGVGTNKIRGRMALEQQASGMIIVRGKICGLTKGTTHGLHIHEFGDARSVDNLGKHYDPEQNPHRLPPNPDRHVGDLRNVFINSTSDEEFERVIDRVTLKGTNSVLGRSFVLSSRADQGVTVQLDGDSGEAIAFGIIGVTEYFVKFDDLNCTALFPPTVPPVVLPPTSIQRRLVPIIFAACVIIFGIGLLVTSFLLWRAGIRKLDEEKYAPVRTPIEA